MTICIRSAIGRNFFIVSWKRDQGNHKNSTTFALYVCLTPFSDWIIIVYGSVGEKQPSSPWMQLSVCKSPTMLSIYVALSLWPAFFCACSLDFLSLIRSQKCWEYTIESKQREIRNEREKRRSTTFNWPKENVTLNLCIAYKVYLISKINYRLIKCNERAERLLLKSAKECARKNGDKSSTEGMYLMREVQLQESVHLVLGLPLYCVCRWNDI